MPTDLDRARAALLKAAVMFDAATSNWVGCEDTSERVKMFHIYLEWRDGLVNAANAFARAARAAEGGEGEK